MAKIADALVTLGRSANVENYRLRAHKTLFVRRVSKYHWIRKDCWLSLTPCPGPPLRNLSNPPSHPRGLRKSGSFFDILWLQIKIGGGTCEKFRTTLRLFKSSAKK
jgi:hypothetical protein